MSTNRLNNLPDDMLWEIYRRLHRSYIREIIFKDEIYEGALEMYWKQSEEIDDDDWEEDMTSDEPDTDSEYSFTDSEF